MQIKTTKLQELVSKSLKGVGNNKLIPLTSLMAIEVKNGVITLVTTDATNYLYIKENIESEDFYVTVEVDTFAKLVARLTSEDTTLDMNDGILVVASGKGSYSIPLPLDDNGGVVKYPNPIEGKVESGEHIGTIQKQVVNTILGSLKPSLAVTMERPCYTGYYMGDIVMATDTNQISALDVNLVTTPQLVNPEMMNLLDVVSDDSIEIYRNGNDIIFVAPKTIVYGATLSGIDNYAVKAIKGLVDMTFPSMCKLPKAELLQVLERIALFVDAFDEGNITLQFTNEGLIITNKQSSGEDVIPYLGNDNFMDYTCNINIDMLRAQIKAQTGDSIELWYGDPKSIKLVDNKLTVLIALLTE